MENQPKTYRLGLDIGGTKMSAVLLDDNQVVESARLATPRDNIKNFLIMLKALMEPLIERTKRDGRDLQSLGLGIAGTIDYHKKIVTASPNLELVCDIKILDKIRALLALDIPFYLDNDASCFTRAEALLGAGKTFNEVYGITIGTGIGGALAINGQIYNGAHGGAGEPGALLVDLEEKITLEQAYQKLTQNNSRLLAQEAYEGDPLAGQIFLELGEYLGLVFANIVNIVDPGIIIIGGGTAGSSDLFLSTARRAMVNHIESPQARKIKIVKAKLGDNAGAIGAALLDR
ncbi:MAG: ROK family protein [Candidatus Falkowbacteria bacterium]